MIMNTQTVATGARFHGAVMHVITKGMHHDVSACGRVVIPGKGVGHRVCRTCIRINSDAFKLDASMRKAEREMRHIHKGMEATEMQEEIISWEFDLNSSELAATLEKIEKINARCANRGIPGGLRVEYREETRKEKNSVGVEIEYVVYPTHITGIAPKLPGWEFAATLDYDQHAGLIVRTYPGVKSIDRDNLREGWCDHCQTNRYRRETYVMRNTETGEFIQVGSSCIKDFTGWTALPVSFDRMAKDVEEMSGGFGSGPRDVTTITALAVAWACVTEYGFIRSNEPNCTKGMVLDVIDPPKPDKWNADYLAELKRISAHSESMYERAAELREFILSDNFAGNSEYVLNLKAIAAAERVSFRNMGILASAPQAWARFLEKSFIKEKEAKPESNWFGEIGERWEISLTLKAIRYIETDFGSSTLHTFMDNDGNVFKWFASNADLADDVDNTLRLSVGIKAHKEFKGTRETALTRVKVIESGETAPKRVKEAPVKAKDEMRVSDLRIDIDGVYSMNGEYFKIRQTKGIAYAVKFTADGWKYSPKSIHVIRESDALTAEQATRFGHDFHQCVYCSRPLTDERSMRAGYGETCAHTHDLPWGE
jgi:hypothetical protein